MVKSSTVYIFAMVSLLLSAGCKRSSESVSGVSASQSGHLTGTVVLFHAGSLSVPLRQVSEAFQKEHPGVKVTAEAAGSRDCARKVADLHQPCDVLAVSDSIVISTMLMPKHAEFNIPFATNEMAIVYTGRSRRQGEITVKNWPEILLSDGIAFGKADPDRDPCGYRTLLVMQLAEQYFNQPGLATRLNAKDGLKFVRPKETDLLALLEAGEIDYLFIYRSVGEQHGLKCLLLPAEINLGSPHHADMYGKAHVEIGGKAAGEKTTVKGEPMIYSVTIPKNAPNQAAAEAYVAFLLSEQGRAIMRRNGQPPVLPVKVEGYGHLPPSLQPYCERGDVPGKP